MLRSRPGDPRFERRAREAAAIGDRELAASSITLGRIDLRPPPPAAALAQDERALNLLLDGLRDHAYLAQELDHALEAELPALARERADAVRLEVLYPLRERRRDLLTQMTIGAQALAALRLAKRNPSPPLRGGPPHRLGRRPNS